MGSNFTILRSFDAARIAQLRAEDEFFWADLALEGGPSAEEGADAFSLSEQATAAALDFGSDGAPARRIHIEDDLIVFPFWCAANPLASLDQGGGEALGLFRVNVLLHGDFLLTVHEHPFDLPDVVVPGRIPAGRSEHYAVYVALDGMDGTVLEALNALEGQIGDLETQMLESGMGQQKSLQEQTRVLRSRITTLRLAIGPARALFERVGEEIELIPALEGAGDDYVDRIQAQLDRGVERLDAASETLTNALQVKLNETTYRLTMIATIFLPLSFIAGFFGMNFGWMVDNIDSAVAFWALGVGLCVASLLVILLVVIGSATSQRGSSTTTGI